MQNISALVTGANRGIGRQLAGQLSAQGNVIGTTRHPAPADDSAITWHQLEATDPASIAALADALKGQPIERLVCNAGIYPDKGESLSTGYPPEMWAEGFAVNVTGAFLTLQALLPNLRAARNPRIALISSQMASDTNANGGSYIYRASKAALLNLGRNLATDLKSDGIAVGIYHPGWVQTDMGGASAAITPQTAAEGLVKRIEALSLTTTGCFETWDGTAHAF